MMRRGSSNTSRNRDRGRGATTHRGSHRNGESRNKQVTHHHQRHGQHKPHAATNRQRQTKRPQPLAPVMTSLTPPAVAVAVPESESESESLSPSTAYRQLLASLPLHQEQKEMIRKRRLEELGKDEEEVDTEDDEEAEEQQDHPEQQEEEEEEQHSPDDVTGQEEREEDAEQDINNGELDDGDELEEDEEQEEDEQLTAADRAHHRDANDSLIAQAHDATELEADDPFLSHFSHFRTLSPILLQQLPRLTQFTKQPSFHTLKEHVFTGNIDLLPPRPTNSPQQQPQTQYDSAEKVLALPSSAATSPLHLNDLHVSAKLITRWLHTIAHKQQAQFSTHDDLPHPLHRVLFPLLNSYRDLIFPSLTQANHLVLVQCYCLHIVNHLLKTRDRVVYHTQQLQEYQQQEEELQEERRQQKKQAKHLQKQQRREKKRLKHGQPQAEETQEPEEDRQQQTSLQQPVLAPSASPPEYRDQGFARPKVLILLPLANTVYTVVNTLISLLPSTMTHTILNHSRFQTEYAPNADVDSPVNPTKPQDYQQLFAGKIHDNFRLGIRLNIKSVKLYSNFYDSDLIIASPLGLRMILSDITTTTNTDTNSGSGSSSDFLSSLDILIFDQADVLSMQNWQHVLYIHSLCNQLPRSNIHTNADYSRIKDYFLSSQSGFFRQSILLTAHMTAEMYHLVTTAWHNYAGIVWLRPVYKGVLSTLLQHTRLTQPVMPSPVFHRFVASSHINQPQDRFDYFFTHLFPQIKKNYQDDGHVLIVFATYSDYLMVRNAMQKKKYKSIGISEYTKQGEVTRNRSYFFHGNYKFLLYTERVHFFQRYHLRGIQQLIFYQLPQYAHLYQELVQWMEPMPGSNTMGICMSLYCEYDARELEQIVGTERAAKMLQGTKNTYVFC